MALPYNIYAVLIDILHLLYSKASLAARGHSCLILCDSIQVYILHLLRNNNSEEPHYNVIIIQIIGVDYCIFNSEITWG